LLEPAASFYDTDITFEQIYAGRCLQGQRYNVPSTGADGLHGFLLKTLYGVLGSVGDSRISHKKVIGWVSGMHLRVETGSSVSISHTPRVSMRVIAFKPVVNFVTVCSSPARNHQQTWVMQKLHESCTCMTCA